MNFVILSGRLTRDPEIKYTNTNKAVVSFSLAVDDGKDRDGNRKATFINCVAWEKTAELVDQHFRKGDGITVHGKLTSRSYEKDGQKRTVTEVNVSGLEWPLTKKETAVNEKASPYEEIEDTGGEIPF